MKSGPFARLWKSGVISATGDWVAILATLSLADELAGGGGIVLALVSRILPGLFFAAVGGVIADRVNRKYAMVTVEIGRAVLVFLLVFVQSITYLVLVNLAMEALTLVFQPARESSVPNLVRRNELVQANSLSLSAAYGTFPLGALLFLALAPVSPKVTLWGLLPGRAESLAFMVDAGSFLISAAILSTIPFGGHELPEARRRKGRLNLMAPLRDLRDGVVFVATHARVRLVVAAMGVALAGGGIIIVIGKPFATEVLLAGGTGFPALITAFGLGTALGVVLVTVFGARFTHKDLVFSLALLVTGASLSAAALVKTLAGAAGWIGAMGLGTGGAYVLGFSHLHEQVVDEVRGRTFAALFSLMRIGLLLSMAVALPLSGLLDHRIPGLLSEGMRVVLMLGGLTIFVAGLATLWRVRRLLVALGHADRRPALEAVTQAFRSYRRSVAGEQLTEEISGVPTPPPPPVVPEAIFGSMPTPPLVAEADDPPRTPPDQEGQP
jgi:dTMP kinase